MSVAPLQSNSDPAMLPLSLPGYEFLATDHAKPSIVPSTLPSPFPITFPATLPIHPTTPTILPARRMDTGALAEIRYFPFPLVVSTLSNDTESEQMLAWQQSLMAWQKILPKLCQLDAHPHIQRVLDYGKTETGLYLVLEHVEGRTLRQILETEGARTLEWTLPVCTQIASALDFAAANHLVHGALNPDNVVLDSATGDVLLCHFGLPPLVYPDAPARPVTAYLAPEQAAGHEGDSRSDVYAFGALLYSCLSARPPFNAATPEQLAQKIQTGTPLPLLAQPTWVRDIILRAMQRVPNYRYRVAVDIVNDLTFQRSPAPLSIDASLAHGNDGKDWSLGQYMPALALKEEVPGNERGKIRRGWFGGREGEESNSGGKTGLLGSLLSLLGLRKRLGTVHAGDMSATTEDTLEPIPVHGLLGRFNRYMALQEYVILDSNDPAWKDIKGWRAFLFRFGIRVPVRAKVTETGRPPRTLIPWVVQRRLGRMMKRLGRVICILVPLALLAMCIHAGLRVQQHGKAWVVRIKGNPTVLRQGKKVPLHYGDVLDGVDMPTLSTDGKSELGIQMADSCVQLSPNTTLRIAQMDYSNGARARRMELVSGQAMMRVEPQNEQELPGHYDLSFQDMDVRALPSDTPVTMIVNYRKGKSSQVAVGQGVAKVSAKGKRKFVSKDEQLTTQGDELSGGPIVLTGNERNLLNARTAVLQPSAANTLSTALPPSMAASLSPALPASFSGVLMHPIVSHWLHLYSGVQEKTFMPLMERAMTLAHLKPENQSALDEARALSTARISLDALMKSLVASDMPNLNLKTLEETGLEEKDRNRILDSFAEHRLLGYRRLENGSCLLLARANNESRTMFEAHDGVITVVPEALEDKELKKF